MLCLAGSRRPRGQAQQKLAEEAGHGNLCLQIVALRMDASSSVRYVVLGVIS